MAAANAPRFFTVYVVLLMLAAATAMALLILSPTTGQVQARDAVALLPAVIGMSVILVASMRRADSEQIGSADLVTVLRAALVCVVVGWALLVLLRSAPSSSWPLTALASVALLLDGVDGAVARRSRPTRAGATLDAETDAVMVLALSLIVAGQVGWWIVLAGGLRYLFAVGAIGRAAWRFRPLPTRGSRRVIAAWSSALLAACTAPLLVGTAATVLAIVSLTLLVWSFGRDVVWLEAHARWGGSRRSLAALAALGGGVVGDVVRRTSLQSGVDAADVLAEDAEAEQLDRADGGHDHHR
ncbi:hypothetical protein BH23ACT6_BH23ACT6_18090 [soil metagenome]